MAVTVHGIRPIAAFGMGYVGKALAPLPEGMHATRLTHTAGCWVILEYTFAVGAAIEHRQALVYHDSADDLLHFYFEVIRPSASGSPYPLMKESHPKPAPTND